MSSPRLIHQRFSAAGDGSNYGQAGEDVLTMRDRFAFAIAMLLAALLPSALAAQTTGSSLPDTPPELREFRLDPENAPRETPKQVTPPPVAPTVEPQPKQAAPAPATQQTIPPREQDRSTASPRENAAPADNGASAQDGPIAEPTPQSDTPATDTQPATTAPQISAAPAADGPAVPTWLPWVAIGAVVAIAALLLLRRRRPKEQQGDYEQASAQSEPESMMAHESPTVPLVAAVPEPVAPLKDRPQLELAFTPIKAVISVANLTVSGRLQVVNNGDAVAENLKLRIALTSARQNQSEIVAAFHADAATFPAEALGDAKPGEHLDLSLDLQVPLSELQSYSVGNQRLFVPVIIANLAYGWNGEADMASIEAACLIGRESTPPKPKMAPLRLDLGPRSFGDLGQRPLAA